MLQSRSVNCNTHLLWLYIFLMVCLFLVRWSVTCRYKYVLVTLSVKGVKGSPGLPGAVGAPGVQGIAGASGPKGLVNNTEFNLITAGNLILLCFKICCNWSDFENTALAYPYYAYGDFFSYTLSQKRS